MPAKTRSLEPARDRAEPVFVGANYVLLSTMGAIDIQTVASSCS